MNLTAMLQGLEGEDLARGENLLAGIADAYVRMATNTNVGYREQQMAHVNEYLAELTELFSKQRST
jgi:hypothetical protein